MLSDETRTRITDVLGEDERVQLAYLFGSHARDHAQEHSDVDIAILHDQTVDNHLTFRIDLMRKLEHIPYDVDITVLNGAHPRLLNQVLQHGELLYTEDEDTRITFETTARSRYLDMKPHIDAYAQKSKQQLMQ